MKMLILFILAFLLLLIPEILRVYWIMPFPGSQQNEVVEMAYFLHNYIIFFRLAGILLIIYPTIYFLRKSKLIYKILIISFLAFYGIVFYLFNFQFLADKMFYEPKNKVFLMQIQNKIPKDRVIDRKSVV